MIQTYQTSMLSRRILNALTHNEVIALCVYFDVDFEVYDETGKVLCVANKYVLINCLMQRTSQQFSKIIYKSINNSRVPLGIDSLVSFGQFTRSNIYCRRVMRKVGLSMNAEAFATVHLAWSHGVQFKYAQLPSMIEIARCHFSRRASRSVALSCFAAFVDSL